MKLVDRFGLESHANGASVMLTCAPGGDDSDDVFFCDQSWESFFAFLEDPEDFEDDDLRAMALVLRKYADKCDAVLQPNQ